MIHLSEVKFYQPLLAGVYCLNIGISKKVFGIIFNLPPIFIDPNYYTLLAIITFYYQFNMGRWFSRFGLLPILSPLQLSSPTSPFSLSSLDTKLKNNQLV